MDRIKQVLKITGQNFLSWKRNPRVWMTFLLAFILALMLSDQVISFAQRYETVLQILEPFIWTFGDADSVMLSSILLMLLFADIPFCSQDTPYTLIRIKRSVWLAGQILYIALATIIYNIFLLMVEGILAAPYSFMGNVWSETAAMLGYGGGGEKITIPVSIKTMESSMPYKCAGIVFLLMLLYSVFVVMFMLVLTLKWNSALGILGGFALNLYGYFLEPGFFRKIFHISERMEYRANLLCGWLSPLNHATFAMHNFGYDYLPRVGSSMLIFGVCIVFFIWMANRQIRCYSFNFSQTDE